MVPLELAALDGVRLDAAVHPTTNPRRVGTVIQVHGITVSMDEGGMFVALAERLAVAGFDVLRFSFRGHGASGGTQRGATIAGEMLDLHAAVDHVAREMPGPLWIVAASFGAVPVALSLPHIAGGLNGLVLWNPVLDLRHTFVEPRLPWGLANFGPEQRKQLHQHGFLLIDREFELGRVMFEEMRIYRPLDYFVAAEVPSLVVHGDQDSYVSYEIAKHAAAQHGRADFHTVEGSDHGFDNHEEEAIRVTVGWLTARSAEHR